MIFIISIIGAQLNVLRGGWPFSEKLLQGILFIASCSFFMPWWHAMIAGFAMWAGAQAGGWGAYVGTMIGDKPPHSEVKWIDTIIKPLEKWPVLWGFVGLSLRGMLWGLLLSMAIWHWLPILAGLSMGLVYLMTLRLGRYLKTVTSYRWPNGKRVFRHDIGWLWGEWMHGFILWYASFVGIMA
jgi:hypothetical protein